MKNCALPECNKPFNNWRMSCCCKSHQSKYSAKKMHGTLGLPNVVGSRYVRKTPKLTEEEIRIKRKIWRANRRQRNRDATPAWANMDRIKEIYLEAELKTIETGIKYEVDHSIPIINPLVCGLHNEFNLRVITLTENRKKNNKFEII